MALKDICAGSNCRHGLAYNLSNFLRTLVLQQEVEHWSLTSIREKLVRIGARLVHHARYAVF
ncbi:hypothetical protein MACH24_31610 [Erythrobacter sp. Dej080120_24]|nr:hypothetical protein MACH24_31610 [Erythrobacter sp. Dej080120_24]